MFQHRTISLRVTFAVDTLLQSEDILGDHFGRPYVELVGHLSKLVQQHSTTMKEWHNPFLPDSMAEDVYKKFTTALQDCQDWVTFDGFNNQCDELMKKSQFQSHPVLGGQLNSRCTVESAQNEHKQASRDSRDAHF